jgi:hypothetical protein
VCAHRTSTLTVRVLRAEGHPASIAFIHSGSGGVFHGRPYLLAPAPSLWWPMAFFGVGNKAWPNCARPTCLPFLPLQWPSLSFFLLLIPWTCDWRVGMTVLGTPSKQQQELVRQRGELSCFSQVAHLVRSSVRAVHGTEQVEATKLISLTNPAGALFPACRVLPRLPAPSHRPLFLVPGHLPKHPLVLRADQKRLLHAFLFLVARRARPGIHPGPHPFLDGLEFR